MNANFRKLVSACLALALMLVALPAAPTQAKGAESSSMPEGLFQAMLESTSEPVSAQGAHSGGLNFAFQAGGLQANGLHWDIVLNGFGRGDMVNALGETDAMQVEGRVQYERPELTEWYRDTALGLEQGFTIRQPPAGWGALVLRLDLSTDMEGALDEDARGLSFSTGEGEILRYDHLKAWDANGMELEARMTYAPGQVEIRVEDAGAAYPVTVDPLIYVEKQIVAEDGKTDDRFGWSVALDGVTALVGARYYDVSGKSDQGAAYVFVRNGTTWSLQQTLTAFDGALGDSFGYSVALDGYTALVGAPFDDVDAKSNQGSAYVFTRSGTTWNQQQKLTASDGATDDRFGESVALSVNTALVSATGDASFEGSAYVFVRSGTTWSKQQKLVASDGATDDRFGDSVALDGDTALVGAWSDDIGANSNQGSAYVFTRGGETWSIQQKLTASDGAANNGFGASVALDGETVLVGAFGGQGAAYVFTRNWIGIWTFQQKLIASDGAEGDDFGASVDLDGNTALVGAYSDNVGANEGQGSAYVYIRDGANWTQQKKLTASDGSASDGFGQSVALSGSVFLVGAPGDNVAGMLARGSAYIFRAHDLVSKNGGFNAYVGASKVPQYWTATNFTTNDGKNTTVKKEGAASVKIGGSGVTKTLKQTLNTRGAAGDMFYLSFWVRGVSLPAGGACRAQVLLYDGAALVMTKTVNCPTGSFAFTKKATNFAATDAFDSVVIKLTYSKASGSVYFDGLGLYLAP